MIKIDFKIKDFSKISIITDMPGVAGQMKSKQNFMSKTLPITSISFVDDKIEFLDKNVIYLMNSKEKRMQFDKINNIAYMFSEEQNIRLADIVYVLLEMFSNQLLQQNKYLLHSSALQYDDNKSVLLIGDANAGKTSLAYKLMRDYKYKLIANDHVVLTLDGDNFITLAGTKEIEMRMGVIKTHFPELSSNMSVDGDNLWSKKIVINDMIEQPLIAQNEPTIVTDIFQINLSEGGSSFVSKKDKVDQLLYLYEQLAEKIKGTYNLITGFEYPLPSLETPERLRQLYSAVKSALDNIEIYMAKGSLDELSKKMVKTIEKK